MYKNENELEGIHLYNPFLYYIFIHCSENNYQSCYYRKWMNTWPECSSAVIQMYFTVYIFYLILITLFMLNQVNGCKSQTCMAILTNWQKPHPYEFYWLELFAPFSHCGFWSHQNTPRLVHDDCSRFGHTELHLHPVILPVFRAEAGYESCVRRDY